MFPGFFSIPPLNLSTQPITIGNNHRRQWFGIWSGKGERLKDDLCAFQVGSLPPDRSSGRKDRVGQATLARRKIPGAKLPFDNLWPSIPGYWPAALPGGVARPSASRIGAWREQMGIFPPAAGAWPPWTWPTRWARSRRSLGSAIKTFPMWYLVLSGRIIPTNVLPWQACVALCFCISIPCGVL